MKKLIKVAVASLLRTGTDVTPYSTEHLQFLVVVNVKSYWLNPQYDLDKMYNLCKMLTLLKKKLLTEINFPKINFPHVSYRPPLKSLAWISQTCCTATPRWSRKSQNWVMSRQWQLHSLATVTCAPFSGYFTPVTTSLYI